MVGPTLGHSEYLLALTAVCWRHLNGPAEVTQPRDEASPQLPPNKCGRVASLLQQCLLGRCCMPDPHLWWCTFFPVKQAQCCLCLPADMCSCSAVLLQISRVCDFSTYSIQPSNLTPCMNWRLWFLFFSLITPPSFSSPSAMYLLLSMWRHAHNSRASDWFLIVYISARRCLCSSPLSLACTDRNTLTRQGTEPKRLGLEMWPRIPKLPPNGDECYN